MKNKYMPLPYIPRHRGTRRFLLTWNTELHIILELCAHCLGEDYLQDSILISNIKTRKLFKEISKHGGNISNHKINISLNELKSIYYYREKNYKITRRYPFIIYTMLDLINSKLGNINFSDQRVVNIFTKLSIDKIIGTYILQVFDYYIPEQKYLSIVELNKILEFWRDTNTEFERALKFSCLKTMLNTNNWLQNISIDKFNLSNGLLELR